MSALYLVYTLTGIYYCCNMIMVALTSVVSVVIIYISDHYQHQPLPQWARKVCIASYA